MSKTTDQTEQKTTRSGATLHYSDGRRDYYHDATLALKVYYALPRGVRVAFRSAGDLAPVYPHDYVDRP